MKQDTDGYANITINIVKDSYISLQSQRDYWIPRFIIVLPIIIFIEILILRYCGKQVAT